MPSIDGFAEVLTSEQSNSCESCMVIRVNVAEGDSEEVTITKSGLAPYGLDIPCGFGTIVTSDLTETITESKNYVIGLNASLSPGGSSGDTTITLTVTGSNQISLTRNHSVPIISC